MRKTEPLAIIAVALFSIYILSCATVEGGDGLSLQDAIEGSAERLAADLPAGTRVAIVSFESESENLSAFIMDELTAAVIGRGIEVADRRNLGAVFAELDFQMTGYVSDESAVSVGRFLGAELVVTGQLRYLGGVHRLAANAINVETAIHVSAPRFDVRNDRALQDRIAALGGPSLAAVPAAPRTAGTYLDRGILFASRGDFDTAILDFTEAIRLNPSFAEAYFWRGNAHRGVTADQVIPMDATFDRGRLDLAIADFTEAIRLNPDFARAYTRRGAIHEDRGNFALAIADHTQAIRIDPNDARSFNNRGSAHFSSGQYALAITDYTQALRINPNHVNAFFNRGLAHFNLMDFNSAIADWEAVLRINPDDADARNNIGVARRQMW